MHRLPLALAGLAVALTTTVGIALPAAAHADDGYARRGAACPTVGAVKPNRSGVFYICEQRADDACPVWHAANPVPGDYPSAPCPTCPTPSLSASASATPTPSSAAPQPPARAVPAPPALDELPVTGLVVTWVFWLGVAMVVGGGAVIVASRRTK